MKVGASVAFIASDAVIILDFFMGDILHLAFAFAFAFPLAPAFPLGCTVFIALGAILHATHTRRARAQPISDRA